MQDFNWSQMNTITYNQCFMPSDTEKVEWHKSSQTLDHSLKIRYGKEKIIINPNIMVIQVQQGIMKNINKYYKEYSNTN